MFITRALSGFWVGGSNVSFWNDAWLSVEPLRKLRYMVPYISKTRRWIKPIKHGRGTRGAAPTSDVATRQGSHCPRVQPHPATWIPRVFSRLAPTQLQLGPIRAESGQLGPKSAETDDSGRNLKKKKKKKVQNAPFD